MPEFQIVIHLSHHDPEQPPSREVLEELTLRVQDVLEREKVALGPAAVADFVEEEVEVEVTVEAKDAAKAHELVGTILRALEKGLDCKLVYRDSHAELATTSEPAVA